jgi:hypothetical protein
LVLVSKLSEKFADFFPDYGKVFEVCAISELTSHTHAVEMDNPPSNFLELCLNYVGIYYVIRSSVYNINTARGPKSY